MPQRIPHTQLDLFETGELLTELCIEQLALKPESPELLPIAHALIGLVRYHEQRAKEALDFEPLSTIKGFES